MVRDQNLFAASSSAPRAGLHQSSKEGSRRKEVTDITNQDLIDGSIVLLNGNRIRVPMTLSKQVQEAIGLDDGMIARFTTGGLFLWSLPSRCAEMPRQRR